MRRSGDVDDPGRMGTLTENVALVTGASHGIGTAVARLFAAEGAAVAVHGRDGDAVARLVAELTAAGGRAVGVVGDLTRDGEADRVVEEAEAAFGPLSILVANAGGNPVPPGPVEEIGLDAWRSAVDANLTLTFLTIAAVLPGMKERGRGSIVTVASAASRRPTAYTPVPYAAAKAGIEALTRLVALQAGPQGVRANCVAPETILTQRNARLIPPDMQNQMVAAHPVRRLGTPDDVAQAALYLASDAAEWVTGITIDVAGGSVIA
jgi:3-oxoacyl-[acyl-carrier protein] reductase